MRITPGPWVALSPSDHGAGDNWWVMTANGGEIVCDLTGQAEESGNARLIAAAPQLLAALEAMLDTEFVKPPNGGGEFEMRADVLENAREAIRKAKGQQPYDDKFRTLEAHAKNLGQLRAREIISDTQFAPDQFVEGYGPLSEMGVTIILTDQEEEANPV